MIKFLIPIFILFFFKTIEVKCQQIDTVYISYHKTVVLIFDQEIVHEDVGSDNVIMAKEGKILKIAAKTKNVHETNLFVETAGGYYSFIVKYTDSPAPKHLTRYFKAEHAVYLKEPEKPKDSADETNLTTKTKDVPAKELNENCTIIELREKTISDVGIIHNKMSFLLTGIFYQDDRMYFKLEIENSAVINYDIELIKFVIRSKKGTLKQAAVQETELQPMYVFNDSISTIKGKNKLTKIFVFEKFTIADDKKLVVKILEKGGDRILQFNVDDNNILKAVRIK
jgi:conjugative transposon TraN protein